MGSARGGGVADGGREEFREVWFAVLQRYPFTSENLILAIMATRGIPCGHGKHLAALPPDIWGTDPTRSASHKQLPENLSGKGLWPIKGHPRRVTSAVHSFVDSDCWRPPMRTLQLRFPDDALPTLDTFRKAHQRRPRLPPCPSCAQRLKGQRLQTVSDTLQFNLSALRKWVSPCAHQGREGLVDRPRSGRPPKSHASWNGTSIISSDQDPLEHGSNLFPITGCKFSGGQTRITWP